jgi:hypothetical protein
MVSFCFFLQSFSFISVRCELLFGSTELNKLIMIRLWSNQIIPPLAHIIQQAVYNTICFASKLNICSTRMSVFTATKKIKNWSTARSAPSHITRTVSLPAPRLPRRAGKFTARSAMRRRCPDKFHRRAPQWSADRCASVLAVPRASISSPLCFCFHQPKYTASRAKIQNSRARVIHCGRFPEGKIYFRH